MTPHLRTFAVAVLLVTGLRCPIQAQHVRWRDATGREVERRCQAAELPKKLPPPDSIWDGTALTANRDAHVWSDTTPLLISLLYREGVAPQVRLLEPDSLPAAQELAILELAARGLRSGSPVRPLGAIRLRLQSGFDGTGTIERSVYCPPAPAPGGPSGVQRIVVERSPGDRLPTPGRRLSVDAQLTIDDAGHVTDVRLINSTGIRELDDQVVRSQFERVFYPALIDGLPVASWVRTSGQRMRL